MGAPMKVLLAVLTFVLLSACGGGGSTTSPSATATGTAYFRIDQVSCVYSGTKSVTFYIADLDVGTESLLTGATSVGYLTKATSAYTRSGHPVVQARLANYTATGGALWTTRSNITVPRNGSVTHAVTC